jgi:hypothetical protein
MAINAQRAFKSDASNDNYLTHLSVSEPEKAQLRGARDIIRTALKAGLADWGDVVKREVLFEVAALERFIVDSDTSLKPKFKMQGSWSYHTLNCTTHEPPQEIDLDDGMFLPVSFLTQNGTTHPAVVSDAYFTAVQSILTPVCDENGWELVTDMPSCVRVKVREGAHIDIALYAIPDEEFETIVEKVEASVRDHMAMENDFSFADNIYPQLPSDHIMLAHRDDGWKPSDPRKLETWFQEAIERHGYQLRRVCRYLKGWRDSNWGECRLSSIALMACAVTAFDEAVTVTDDNRDDLALSMAADRLPGLLSNRIKNPVVDGQFLDEKWDGCRDEFVTAASRLAGVLRNALTSTNPSDARDRLVSELGQYMPTEIAYYVAEAPGPPILREGILKSLGDDDVAPAAVQVGGDDRYG